MKRIVVEELIYDRSNEDFENFLLRIVERLKVFQYHEKLIVKIVRQDDDIILEVKSTN